MNHKAIIEQLESLKENSESMARCEDADPIWKLDVEALEEAIKIIKEHEPKERKGKKMKCSVETEIWVEISRKYIHAVYGDIITRRDFFTPFFVLYTYFDPVDYDLYEAGEISEKELRKRGTGYVDAVDQWGMVRRLQSYEYYILAPGELTQRYKSFITEKWKCDALVYQVGRTLPRNKKRVQRNEPVQRF